MLNRGLQEGHVTLPSAEETSGQVQNYADLDLNTTCLDLCILPRCWSAITMDPSPAGQACCPQSTPRQSWPQCAVRLAKGAEVDATCTGGFKEGLQIAK